MVAADQARNRGSSCCWLVIGHGHDRNCDADHNRNPARWSPDHCSAALGQLASQGPLVWRRSARNRW